MDRSRLASAILLGLVAGACANPLGGLAGAESDHAWGGVRASWEVPRRVLSDGKPPAHQYLFEIESTVGSGEFTQALESGESLTIDGTTFSGPSDVVAGFDVQQIAVDGRLRLRNEVGLGVDAIAGLGFTRLDLEAATAATSADLDQQGFGPVLGTGLFFELPPQLRFYAELTWQPTFVGAGDVADVRIFDVGLDLRLTEALGLILSWRDFAYREERGGAESDLDLTARGPRLTLTLQF
ncbi:MAG TPA: hypothetical protein VMT18_15040 [Planctomycetota bacterium]|nr:hypothetical protein [Planctomycetota bacterium]